MVGSATANQLTATVPSAATTGHVSVTSPNGTATSTANFTVTAATGAPTITSFTPTKGVPSNSVSVTGTNFDLTLANDKLRLNGNPAGITSVTSSTALAATIPVSTGSGRLSILTPKGTGTSSQDFYVPFGAHTAADIASSARINAGGSATVALGTANKIGMLLFDGVAGQHVGLQLDSSTYSTCTVYLIAPDNTTVKSGDCTSATTSLDTTILARSGTYAIGIEPGASTGSLHETLVSDVTAPFD